MGKQISANNAQEQLCQYYREKTFRPDIQGIRAIGALLIMSFHIWLNRVSGGVDIFFVISSFLMTSVLLSSFARHNKLAPIRFWVNIVSRVTPSAVLVLSLTFIVGIFLVPPPLKVQFINEIIASLLHIENIQLIRLSVDYLNSDLPPSPVQHFWALSIQMQFYFTLPFVVALCLFFISHQQKATIALLTLFVIVVSSLAFSIYYTSHSPASAYFNPLARAWEFYLGCTLAFILPFMSIKALYCRIAGVAGLALLVIGAFFVPSHLNYPGYVALVPVLAALLLIYSGIHSSAKFNFPYRFLTAKPLVALGNISFLVYLIHWPILVFYKTSTGVEMVSLSAGLSIIIASIILAFAVTYGYEKPIVRRTRANKTLIPTLTALAFTLTSFSMVYSYRADLHSSIASRVSFWESGEVHMKKNKLTSLSSNEIDYEDILSARMLLPDAYKKNCHQDGFTSDLLTCSYGDNQSKTVIALIGGSHSTQWLPALQVIAKKHNWHLLNITKSGCPFGAINDSNQSCREWNDNLIDYLITLKPSAVITTSTRVTGEEYTSEYIPSPYIQAWTTMQNAGVSVIGIRDNPRFDYNIPECIYQSNDYTECNRLRTELFQAISPAVAYRNLITEIDMTDYLCNSITCPVVHKGIIMYRDSHHISVPYVRSLTNILEEKIIRKTSF